MNDVEFKISPENITQVGFSWSFARNVGISKIIHGAFEIIKKLNILKKEYSIRIGTADFPQSHYGSQSDEIICFDAVTDNFENKEVFPDFIFGNWIDIGLENWDDFILDIQNNNNLETIEYEKIFWSGSIITSRFRTEYLNISEKYPEFFSCFPISWKQEKDGITSPVSFVSWKDHCKYKYLLDIPGYSWGSRLKFIPYCNRPLFVSDRKFWTWSCIEILKQNLHIPVKENFENLIEKYKWAEENQELVFNNSKKLLEFCIDNFSFNKVCERAANLIINRL